MTAERRLTKKMRAAYLKSPLRCPWCRSGDIDSVSELKADSGEARQSARCSKCGRCWTEFYKLARIQEEI
ncbi:MAG TPA: hypothetical protein DCZ94_09025 [Lentisphaeria bacterium]|nr:MAG: hypothetical protein A2X48_23380 [Lentisphaerae bacterium GWF2_49_21]HBC87082.1 hypothetical protein [Lentisphaeria bacterium]